MTQICGFCSSTVPGQHDYTCPVIQGSSCSYCGKDPHDLECPRRPEMREAFSKAAGIFIEAKQDTCPHGISPKVKCHICWEEALQNNTADPVNHPPHYTSHPSGVECITVTEHMNFNLGNAVKYIWRADLKSASIEDLQKAAWYVNREIERRQKGS